MTAITNNSYATASLMELKLIQRKEGARRKEMALGWIVMLERNKKKCSGQPLLKNRKSRLKNLLEEHRE